jgi:succinoglycan biosynthesis transport protein ExoP
MASRTSADPGIPVRAVAGESMTLSDLIALLKRRKRYIFASLAFFLCLATLYCTIATRQYDAEGVIQIQKESSSMDLSSVLSAGDVAGGASDSLDTTIILQTQVSILESDTLALQVIKELNLEPTQNFFPHHDPSPLDFLRKIKFWSKPLEPLSVPIDNAPNRRAIAIKIFSHRLKTTMVAGTRLIEIHYSDPNPQRAAAVVNHLITDFVGYTFQTRFDATSTASTWLSSQLTDLKRQTEQLQSRALILQRETGMFGDDESHNIILARLQSLNDTFTIAESNRILKEAIYRITSSGDPELISGLSGNSGMGAVAPIANSLALVQTLRAQEALIRTQIADDRVKYGPSYQKLAEMQAQLVDIDKSISDETSRIGERAHTDYEIAARTEKDSRDAFETQKREATELNDKAIAYSLAKEEADKSRELYEDLLGKLKQAGILEGLKSTNVTIVDPGRIPPPDSPKSPNIPALYAIAIAAGIFFGVLISILVDSTDQRIRSISEAEVALGATMLGLLPAFEGSSRSAYSLRSGNGPRPPESAVIPQLPASSAPNSVYTEALRSLRTSLMLSRPGAPPQVLLITSSVASEGKSTLAANLAVVYAQQNAKVLLIDGDLRRPILNKRLHIDETVGLSAALSGPDASPVHAAVPELPNLHVMIAGSARPPFPSELLASPKMTSLIKQWRQEYDYILLDSPPVLPVTDAVIMSQFCDATLLVVRHARTSRLTAQAGYRALVKRLPSEAVLGVVLNAVSQSSGDYRDYYGYYGNQYSSEGEKHERLH